MVIRHEHCLITQDSCCLVVCAVCHDRYQIALPQPLWAMLAMVDGFKSYHQEFLTDETGDDP